MNETEDDGTGGAETAEEAMVVAVMAPRGNLIVTPDSANTLQPTTEAPLQGTRAVAAAAAALVTAGDFIIHSNLMLGTLA